MSTFYIKQNDTGPAIAGTLERPDGTAVVVTGAAVRFHLRARGGTSTKVDAVATILNGAAGSVKYDWQVGDTDTGGYFEAEWEVTYSDGSVETFPNYGNQPVIISLEIA